MVINRANVKKRLIAIQRQLQDSFREKSFTNEHSVAKEFERTPKKGWFGEWRYEGDGKGAIKRKFAGRFVYPDILLQLKFEGENDPLDIVGDVKFIKDVKRASQQIATGIGQCLIYRTVFKKDYACAIVFHNGIKEEDEGLRETIKAAWDARIFVMLIQTEQVIKK